MLGRLKRLLFMHLHRNCSVIRGGIITGDPTCRWEIQDDVETKTKISEVVEMTYEAVSSSLFCYRLRRNSRRGLRCCTRPFTSVRLRRPVMRVLKRKSRRSCGSSRNTLKAVISSDQVAFEDRNAKNYQRNDPPRFPL